MLGSICLVLCIIYLFGSYFAATHYLLVLSVLINLIVLSIWSGKLTFNQALKKFFTGEIFWSFLWILWIYCNPNIFILNQSLISGIAEHNIQAAAQGLNSKQGIQQIVSAGSSKLLQQESLNSFSQNANNFGDIMTNSPLRQSLPMDLSAIILLPLLFHLPLMISNLGKLYMLCSNPQKVDSSLLEELIIFQSKLQLGIFFYCLLEIIINVLSPDLSMVITIVALGLILKAKFNCHYGTQKAYKQLHFAIDRLSKSLGLRNIYHALYKVMSLGYLNIISQKSVTY